MSNVLHTRKNDRWIRHHTGSFILNDDAETHLRAFNQQKKVFRMSIAKATFRDTDTSIIGYFQETWQPASINIPNSVNTAVAFSGWADPDTAVSSSASFLSSFGRVSNRVLSLGGGNNNGVFTSSDLNNIQTYCRQGQTGKFKGYNGLMFDIEGSSQPSTSDFTQTFNLAKSNGFAVYVTVSFSGNAGVPIPSDLLAALLSSTDITYLVPQIYQIGNENPPPVTASGVNWTPWKTAIPEIVVAIPFPNQYEITETWFSQCMGIKLSGFIGWDNIDKQPTPPSSIPCSGGGGGGGGNFNITLSVYNNTNATLTVVPGSSNFTPNAGQSLTLTTKGSSVTGTTAVSNAQVELNLSTSTQNNGDIQYSSTGGIGYATGSNISDGTIVTISLNGTQLPGSYTNGSGWFWQAFNGTIASGSTIVITFTN